MFQFAPDSVSAYPTSPAERYRINRQAILIAKRINAEQREATSAEREILVQYSGWGDTQVRKLAFDWIGEPIDSELSAVLTPDEKQAIRKSTLNAHYTGLDVARAMWAALGKLGVNVTASALKILEPACGSGVFFGTAPTLPAAQYHGVELDTLTAQICQAAYPETTIHQCGLEQAGLGDNSFDVVIGNVPFGDYKVADASIKWGFLKKSIHDYFIAKSINLLKPHGIACLITSRYTLDKQDSSVREWLSKHAELIAAYRLPDNAFEASAGTEVVTDILILRKRLQPVAMPDAWVGTVEKQITDGAYTNKVHTSTYYEEHPENVLGTYARGKMYVKFGEFPLTVRGNGEHIAKLKHLIDRLSPLAQQPIAVITDPCPTPIAINPACSLARRVYDRAKEVLQAQINHSDTSQARKRLNSAYDAYRAHFGTFTSSSNSRKPHQLDEIKNEGWYAFLLALEDHNGNKAPIFYQDTVARTSRYADGLLKLSDAVHVCLDQIGAIDIAYLSKLTGLPSDTLSEQLPTSNLAFQDPNTQRWIHAPEYLSGNVREKLTEAQAAAKLDPRFTINVQALTAAQPEPLQASEIKAAFGAHWLPAEIYTAFIRSLFPGYSWGVKVSYLEPTSAWILEITNPGIINSAENLKIYGTNRLSAIELIEDGLNLRIPVVYDEFETAEGKTSRVRNEQATAAAQGKLIEIKARWESWLWSSAGYPEQVCALYNANFNGFRLRQYDGGYLTFPGLALTVDGKPYQLRKHQRSGVARIISKSGYDNSAFPVYQPGYGKTDTGICGVVKATQLGMVSKTCIVVPKHTLGQWRERFTKLYPGLTDEMLCASDASFSTRNRRAFLSRIVSGGYRYVLMTFEQFRTIPLSEKTFTDYLSAEIAALADYINDTAEKTVESRALQREFKRREKALAKFEAKYKEQWDKISNSGKEAPITWEQCGFDCLVIDELHYAKKDVISSKMENVAGLPRGESQRAFDARVKAHYVLGVNGSAHGGKVIGLTGTPLTNTLAEAYVWMRFCQPRLLKKLGLWHFDAWASTFTEPFTSIEMDSVGNFRQQTRLRFQNIPELLTLLAECWDRAPEAPEVCKPKIVGGQMRVVEVPGSEALINYTAELAQRAQAVRRREVEISEDNMLVITSDGRKASLFNGDPKLGFVPGVRTKVDALCDEIWRYYRESYRELGTQIVFCDLYTPKERDSGEWRRRGRSIDSESGEPEQEDLLTDSERRTALGVYGTIKQKLVDKGLRASEIEFAHDVHSDDERLDQHERMRRGICRVLIGSTGKLGTGVNVQDQIIAVHNLDCPWRPDELEQRNARGVRDGNSWPAVNVLCYVTQRSYDPVIWQMVEYKSRFISQIMTGTLTSRTADDIGTMVLTAGMAKAIALGDDRVVEKIKIETELTQYERQWRAWYDTRQQMRIEADKLPSLIAAEENAIQTHRQVIDRMRQHMGEFVCSLREVGGSGLNVQTSPQEASEHVRKLANLLGRVVRSKAVFVGMLQGMSLYLENWLGTLALTAYLDKAEGFCYRVTGLTYQNARSIEQLLAEFNNCEMAIRRCENQIKVLRSRAETNKLEVSKHWSSEGIVRALLEKYAGMCKELAGEDGLIDMQTYMFRWE